MDNATKILELARQKFDKLTEAEKKLFRAVANGEVADYSAKDEKDNDPAKAGNWGPERVLKADRLAWVCTDKQASELVTHRGIRLEGTRIEEKLDLEYGEILFPLIFEKSNFPQGMNLRDAKIRELNLDGTHTGPIDGDGLRVDGCLFLSEGFEAQGEVRLIGAKIRGDLDCEKARFINHKADAISGRGLKVEGCVYLRYGFKSEGEICMAGAIIGENFDCSGGHFINEGETTLDADGMNIKGNIFFRNGFKAVGAVRLVGAKIGENLECNNSEFINQHSSSLNCERLDVKGDVFLCRGNWGEYVIKDSKFNSIGEVNLVCAKIAGDLVCRAGHFINRSGYSLLADGMKVEGSVVLRDGFNAEGEVNLLGATIGGDLDCRSSQFNNIGGVALLANALKIEGSAFLCDGYKAQGEVSFVNARINGFFYWMDVHSPEQVKLDLRSAKVGTLRDDKQSWPQSGKLFLRGLAYDEIHNMAPKDTKSRIDWLRRQGDFWPQPYEQLTTVLRKNGRDVDAMKILIAKNKDKARLTKLSLREWPWYRLFGPIIGYGYKPWRACWIGLCWILIGAVIFGIGRRADIITPPPGKAITVYDRAGKKVISLPEDYPKFNALTYSLQVFVPLKQLREQLRGIHVFLPDIGVDQTQYWLPNPNRGPALVPIRFFTLHAGGLLLLYTRIQSIAGLALTTLFLVGLKKSVRT